MISVNIKDARASLGKLVDRATRGETVIITRHGRKSARLAPMPAQTKSLPSLHDFRSRIAPPKTGLSRTVGEMRQEERS
jgi:prevent-host-death family protein